MSEMDNEIKAYGGETLGSGSMMQTASTINIPSTGGTLTFYVESEPYPPKIKYSGSAMLSYYDESDGMLSFTIKNNDSEYARFGELEIIASTTADSSYNGVASCICGYTINQEDGGRKLKFNPITIDVYNDSAYSTLNVTVTMWFTTELGSTEKKHVGGLANDLPLMIRDGFEMPIKNNSFVICNISVLLNESQGSQGSSYNWESMSCSISEFSPNPDGINEYFGSFFEYDSSTRGYVATLSPIIINSYPSSAPNNNVQPFNIKLLIS